MQVSRANRNAWQRDVPLRDHYGHWRFLGHERFTPARRRLRLVQTLLRFQRLLKWANG
jgi:hypothetical protein